MIMGNDETDGVVSANETNNVSRVNHAIIDGSSRKHLFRCYLQLCIKAKNPELFDRGIKTFFKVKIGASVAV